MYRGLVCIRSLCLALPLFTSACGGESSAPGAPSSNAGKLAAAGSGGAGTTAVAGSSAAAGRSAAGTTATSAAGTSAQAGRAAGGAGAAGSTGAAGTSMTMAGSSAPAAGGGGGPSTEHFSFFMASQAGLFRLSGNANGFGGDLRFGKADGLSGADEICKRLAEASLPGNGKTWRAFLSVTKGSDGKPVNAIDRVGEGPWYDRRGRVFAMNKVGLMNTRPAGINSLIANDLPNEDGVPNHDPGTGIVDNHNVMTGSTTSGTLDAKGLTATCQDWTSKAADGGQPRCGVSWPRAQLMHWISTLNEGGCAPGATQPGQDSGTRGTVGALGGYGGFYCFALTP